MYEYVGVGAGPAVSTMAGQAVPTMAGPLFPGLKNALATSHNAIKINNGSQPKHSVPYIYIIKQVFACLHLQLLKLQISTRSYADDLYS